MGAQLLWGTAGGVVSLVVPGLVASSLNTGFTGYALNGATAWAGSMLLARLAGPKAAGDFLVGGIVATGLRIFNNFFGSSLPIGLSGGGMGFYLQNSFPLPTASNGPFMLNDGYSGGPMASVPISAQNTMAAAAAMPAAGQPPDEPSRWSKWTA
jgi:hypothetical protein